MKKLQEYIHQYANTKEQNEWVYSEFTKRTDEFDNLKKHRDYIEEKQYGFGDRAFHYMWYLVLEFLHNKYSHHLKLLEIGVFKGQVISLWSLISKINRYHSTVYALSPFKGNTSENQSVFKKIISRISPISRKYQKVGNLYGKKDYLLLIKELYKEFELDFSDVVTLKGFSTNKDTVDKLNGHLFHCIYIDGDHSFETVNSDILNFAPKVIPGGILVMDDASCNLPGGENGLYWKGHQSVSDACEIITQYGFSNVLNVGHNRIYLKQE